MSNRRIHGLLTQTICLLHQNCVWGYRCSTLPGKTPFTPNEQFQYKFRFGWDLSFRVCLSPPLPKAADRREAANFVRNLGPKRAPLTSIWRVTQEAKAHPNLNRYQLFIPWITRRAFGGSGTEGLRSRPVPQILDIDYLTL